MTRRQTKREVVARRLVPEVLVARRLASEELVTGSQLWIMC